jgi:hypothetical protein
VGLNRGIPVGVVIKYEEGLFLRALCNAVLKGLQESPLIELECVSLFKGGVPTFTVTHIALDPICETGSAEEHVECFLDQFEVVYRTHQDTIKQYIDIKFKLLNTSRSEVSLGIKERYFTTKRMYTLKHSTCLNYLPFSRFR